MSDKQLKLYNSIALIFMLTLNAMAIILPIGGRTTGELSDMYPNLFVPAGFTFSIWSVIYILLIVFVIYQWIVSLDKSRIHGIGPWFLINGLANGCWILAWHYLQIELSLFIMLILLYSLLKIHQRLQINYFTPKSTPWLVFPAFSIYLGWISVATIANFTTLLVSYDWSGGPFSQDTWAALMLSIAVVLGVILLYRHKDVFYAAVIAWASYGILSKRRTEADAMDSMIQHFSEVGMYVMIIGILLTITIGIVGIQKKRL